MILITSFISSLEINKVNRFPALTALFPLTFISNWFIAFKVKLLTNPGKMSLAEGIAILASAFFTKLPGKEPKDPSDWVILDIWLLLSFVSADILLAKEFLVLVVCLVFRNNWCGNSSSSQFFLINLNNVPVGITSSAVGIETCTIAARIKKYKSVIKKKKKHDKIVFLGNDNLNAIEVLIFKSLIDSYISHDEFVWINNVLREYIEI